MWIGQTSCMKGWDWWYKEIILCTPLLWAELLPCSCWDLVPFCSFASSVSSLKEAACCLFTVSVEETQSGTSVVSDLDYKKITNISMIMKKRVVPDSPLLMNSNLFCLSVLSVPASPPVLSCGITKVFSKMLFVISFQDISFYMYIWHMVCLNKTLVCFPALCRWEHASQTKRVYVGLSWSLSKWTLAQLTAVRKWLELQHSFVDTSCYFYTEQQGKE